MTKEHWRDMFCILTVLAGVVGVPVLPLLAVASHDPLGAVIGATVGGVVWLALCVAFAWGIWAEHSR